ncbi:hypothetical protein DL93DRAFT_2221959 [Clavulina sp. PMI_390]|nr:hypothetical protein DL93DRAFT_2221959 [Clavulina sp. PMI_390]
MNVSSTVLATQDDIRLIYESWKISTGTTRDVLTDDIRWRTAIYVTWKNVFIYPVMEKAIGLEAVQKDRDLFAPAKEFVKELDKHIEVVYGTIIKPDQCLVVDKPAAHIAVEKLWAALLPSFIQVQEDLPAFEAKLSKEQTAQLFRNFDDLRKFWVVNLATPWHQRNHVCRDGGELLDKPVDELLQMYKAHMPTE